MLKKNIITNYIGTAVLAVINITGLYLYVNIYGIARWGEIAGLIAIINGMMFLDLGISQIYIPKYNESKNKDELFEKYLKGVTLLAALAVVLILILGSVPSGKEINVDSVSRIGMVTLVGLLFFFNFLNGMFYTQFNAMQDQVTLNIRQVAFAFLKNISTIASAVYISSDVTGYFFVFSFVAGIEFLFNKKTLAGSVSLSKLKLNHLTDLFHDLKKPSLAIAAGILAFNFDRLFLSKMIDHSTFGVYSIVVTVALYFIQLQYPVTKAVFPYISKKLIEEKVDESWRDLARHMMLVSALTLPVFLLGFLFSAEILGFFLKESPATMPLALFRVLIFCALINTVYNVFYIRMLAKFMVNSILVINFLGLIISLVIFILIGHENPYLAGILSWLSISLIQLIGGVGCIAYAMRKNVLKSSTSSFDVK